MKRKIRNIIYSLLVLVCIGQMISIPQIVMAKEISGQKHGLDVTFVVDVSGSMKTNDPNGIARDMVKAFIDTVQIQNIRVGFVAYNDKIVLSTSPVPIVEQSEREQLKELIDTVSYSGNTDIGLGLTSAYQSMPKEEGRNRIIVLISDGESDLNGSNTGRTLEQSNQELLQTVDNCHEEEVPIYTIAFGDYDGSKEMLGNIAKSTSANTYSAQSPELLMEVLYDIFNHNLSYKIQKVSTGIYAKGSQEIRCILDEVYLNEIDVLLISPQKVGESTIQYGEVQIPLIKTSYYAVGKIAAGQISSELKSLIVNTNTDTGQHLDIYVISYRDLEPFLNVETEMSRNVEYPYEVYFKEKDGSVIRDGSFYQTFEWDMDVLDSSQNRWEAKENNKVSDGVLQGNLTFDRSGEYLLTGKIHDNLGAYQFRINLVVENTPPTGSLPDKEYTILSKKGIWILDEYFTDAENDSLEYSLQNETGESAELLLENGVLTIKPLKPGLQETALLVSDGEALFTYPILIRVRPLWQVYWWVIAIILLIAPIILWKILSRPKVGILTFADIRSHSRFTGRLDLYFTGLPGEREIPPLVFHMHKIQSSKIRLGELLNEYPKETEQLKLNQVYFIADEDRKMILYHTSDSTVMIRNSIACKQTRYSLSFGDVVYITSEDGAYDLEIHYIAMIQ